MYVLLGDGLERGEYGCRNDETGAEAEESSGTVRIPPESEPGIHNMDFPAQIIVSVALWQRKQGNSTG